MTSIHDHPELSLGPNPFLEGISPFISFADLPRQLAYAPLTDSKWQLLPPDRREPLLDICDRHFVSTGVLLDPASGVQSLLRRTLVLINPLNPLVRKRCNQVGMAETAAALRSLTPAQGGGMLLSGMTATGKTALLKRVLEVIAPMQVIDHGNSEVGGYYGLRQCVYLIVDHPSNGTRGGLLKRILQCLDSKLETSYYEEHKRSTNIDSLLVTVCKLLIRHRVAVLCIDEKQESTFEDSPWRLEFALFYLNLMNLGVSVVLCGNPLAFDHLQIYSQVMRRFSQGGIYELRPASIPADTWWNRDFVPKAREFSLVENWHVDEEFRSKMENQNSAGIPGLFMAYHQEVQRSALRRGGTSTTVTKADYAAAQGSPRFTHLRDIAVASSSEEARIASQFVDIPHLRAREHKGSQPNCSANDVVPPPSKKTIAATERLLRSFMAKQTKQANQLAEEIKTLRNLPPEDIRLLGVNKDLLKGLEKQLESMKPTEKKAGQKR